MHVVDEDDVVWVVGVDTLATLAVAPAEGVRTVVFPTDIKLMLLSYVDLVWVTKLGN